MRFVIVVPAAARRFGSLGPAAMLAVLHVSVTENHIGASVVDVVQANRRLAATKIGSDIAQKLIAAVADGNHRRRRPDGGFPDRDDGLSGENGTESQGSFWRTTPQRTQRVVAITKPTSNSTKVNPLNLMRGDGRFCIDSAPVVTRTLE